MDILLLKKELRKEAKAYRNSLCEDDRLNKSTQMIHHLKFLKEFRNADAFLMYASLQGEVETLSLIKELLEEGKKNVYCPVTNGDKMEFYRIKAFEDLKEGNFHVLEPEVVENNLFIPEKNKNYCMIMPGLMFDKKGNRLGYGKGYYDRYMSRYNGAAVGLCYSEELRAHMYHGRYDRAVDAVVSEKWIRRCKKYISRRRGRF